MIRRRNLGITFTRIWTGRRTDKYTLPTERDGNFGDRTIEVIEADCASANRSRFRYEPSGNIEIRSIKSSQRL
jgi:hypothetical protein